MSEFENNKRDHEQLIDEKDRVEAVTIAHTRKTQSYLMNKVKLLEQDIQRNNTKQKAENSRIQAQISNCKEIR